MSLVILRPESTAYVTFLFARSKGTSNSMCKNLNILSNSVLPIFSNINERHHPFVYPIIQIQNLLIINGMNALFKHSSDHWLLSISPSVSYRILSIITTTVIVQITLLLRYPNSTIAPLNAHSSSTHWNPAHSPSPNFTDLFLNHVVPYGIQTAF